MLLTKKIALQLKRDASDFNKEVIGIVSPITEIDEFWVSRIHILNDTGETRCGLPIYASLEEAKKEFKKKGYYSVMPQHAIPIKLHVIIVDSPESVRDKSKICINCMQ